jgi:hypothetical protein
VAFFGNLQGRFRLPSGSAATLDTETGLAAVMVARCHVDLEVAS